MCLISSTFFHRHTHYTLVITHRRSELCFTLFGLVCHVCTILSCAIKCSSGARDALARQSAGYNFSIVFGSVRFDLRGQCFFVFGAIFQRGFELSSGAGVIVCPGPCTRSSSIFGVAYFGSLGSSFLYLSTCHNYGQV